MKTSPQKRSSQKIKHYVFRGALYTCILLLLLIPTYIATATYFTQKNAPDETINTVYTALELQGPTGVKTQADEENNAELFTFFASMLSLDKESSPVPETHLAGEYTAIMQNDTISESFKFYFSTNSIITSA